VVPVCPAAGANGFVGFLARLDFHRRDEAFFLPVGEALTDKIESQLLASEIVFGDGAVVFGGAGIAGFLVDAGFDPADAVESFLEDIVRARDEVGVFPEAEAVRVVEGAVLAVAGGADGFDGGGIEAEFFEDGVDDAALADGAELGGFHFGGAGGGLDVDAVALLLGQWDEGGDSFGFFPDDPGWGERDEPAGFRAKDFHAVEVGIGAPDLGGEES